MTGLDLQIPLQTNLTADVGLPFVLRPGAVKIKGAPVGRFVRVAVLGPDVHLVRKKAVSSVRKKRGERGASLSEGRIYFAWVFGD